VRHRSRGNRAVTKDNQRKNVAAEVSRAEESRRAGLLDPP
jgi:hypothetical protein